MVPVTIIGSRNVILKKKFEVRVGCEINVIFSPPVYATEYSKETITKYVEKTRMAIKQELARFAAIS
ncbi:hypothetical protein ACFL27_03375 [candidate division CSSED10-310 bacterium]|uniref:1-acyl-sn-glycerol-3-phosphate acyltransferase n=1 Tax=candidate division CSSED10-310 bacterium TaxID=2855610 RepID=A0ABV6YSR3_UNCC1